MRKILLFLTILILAGAAFMYYKVHHFYQAIYQSGTPNKPEAPQKTTYNILMLGYGGGNHDGTYLTDSIMVIHLDTKTKRAVMVSIPRDIWITIPTESGGGFNTKINAAYEIGLFPQTYPAIAHTFKGNDKALLAKYEVEQITGLPVDNYVAVDFEGFKKVIDSIGGVDITVDKTFDDYEYPLDGEEKNLCGKTEADLPDLLKVATEESQLKAFPCRYEHLHFDKGPIHMDGATALKFARSRHSLQDGSDFGRAARQQKVVLAVKEKVLSLSFLPHIIPLLTSLQNDIQIDISVPDIQKLLSEGKNAKQYKISNLVLSGDNFLTISTSTDGQSIVIPKAGLNNWTLVKSWIQDTIDGKIATSVAKLATPSGKLLIPTTKLKK